MKKESFELTMPAASVVNRILILPFENLGQQSSSSWYFVESYRLQFGSENIQEYGPETIWELDVIKEDECLTEW